MRWNLLDLPTIFSSAVVALFIILSQKAIAEPDFTEEPLEKKQPVAENLEPVVNQSMEDAEPESYSVAEIETDFNTSAKPDKFVIATWGGAYKKAQELAYFQPFRAKTQLDFSVQVHSGDLSELKSTDNKIDHSWDVVDLSSLSLREACDLGLLEELDAMKLDAAPDGTPVVEDFLPDSIHRCGIGNMAWSFAIIYDKTTFRKRNPVSASDFFDVKKFPGRRSLPKRPQYTLELALLADGAAPTEIYALLETDDGLQRAFSALNKIKDHIVWWQNSAEPFRHLDDKEVVMATAFSGRIFTEVATKRKTLNIIWDGQIYDTVYWSIPKSSRSKDKALQFIKFATSPEKMAGYSMLLPYGPLRRSAVPMIGKHSRTNIPLKRFLPTHPVNLKNALALDSQWWQQNQNKLEKKFMAWLNGSTGNASGQEATAGTENSNPDL